MLKGRGIIVFFAVVALLHVMNVESKSFSSGLGSLPDTLGVGLHEIGSGVESGIKQGEKLVEGIHSGVVTFMSSPGSITPSKPSSTESDQPSALALKSNDDSEVQPAPAIELATEEPSA